MYVRGSVCVYDVSLPCDRWAPAVAAHMGMAESHILDATTFTLPNFFLFFLFVGRGGGLNPVELGRLKICSSALAGFVCMCEHQKARAGQGEAGSKKKPQSQFRELDFNVM